MNTDKSVWDTRRIVWLAGWIIVALMLISLALIMFNTFASTDGHVSPLGLTVL